jgi:hypothetical protein
MIAAAVLGTLSAHRPSLHPIMDETRCHSCSRHPTRRCHPAFAIGMAKLVRLMAKQAAADHYERCAPASRATNDPGTPAA